MTKQRLHPNLNELDILTNEEFTKGLGHHFDAYLRDQWRTLKLMKLPQIRGTAAGATLNLAQFANDGAPVGPEQGFVWSVRRMIVASNVPADTAKYSVYSGSDQSLFDSAHLLDNFTAAGGGLPVGVGYYPSAQAVWLWSSEQIYAQISGATAGNQYVLSGIAIEVAAERVGALIG